MIKKFVKGAWVDEIEFPGEGELRIDGIPAGTGMMLETSLMEESFPPSYRYVEVNKISYFLQISANIYQLCRY